LTQPPWNQESLLQCKQQIKVPTNYLPVNLLQINSTDLTLLANSAVPLNPQDAPLPDPAIHCSPSPLEKPPDARNGAPFDHSKSPKNIPCPCHPYHHPLTNDTVTSTLLNVLKLAPKAPDLVYNKLPQTATNCPAKCTQPPSLIYLCICPKQPILSFPITTKHPLPRLSTVQHLTNTCSKISGHLNTTQ